MDYLVKLLYSSDSHSVRGLGIEMLRGRRPYLACKNGIALLTTVCFGRRDTGWSEVSEFSGTHAALGTRPAR